MASGAIRTKLSASSPNSAVEGFPFDQALLGTADTAAERFDEAMPVIAKLIKSTEPFSHDGEF
ncbi:hypothetical protein WJ438_03230 [Streptomyces sp. GD-15H]|uniref:hypothetical protein n=1 Tax=Streptomyces sp. GD-15H TaxID=3129112 RepID=UPI00324918E1